MRSRNKVFRLRGSFDVRGAGDVVVSPSLSTGAFVSVSDINALAERIRYAVDFWEDADIFCDPIVSVRYIRIIPKTKRAARIFGTQTECSIVGAHYDESGNPEKLVIVYRIPIATLRESVDRLGVLANIVSEVYGGKITSVDLAMLFPDKNKLNDVELKELEARINRVARCGMTKTEFGKLISDVFYIEDIFIETGSVSLDYQGTRYVSFYDTGLSESELLKHLGFGREPLKVGDNRSGFAFGVGSVDFNRIVGHYPFLVSMAVKDFNERSRDEFVRYQANLHSIEDPLNEPVIGLIDTFFDNSVYFSKWVESHQDDEMAHAGTNKDHATAIASILVDGPSLNPSLDDGCGRFKVRHFGLPMYDSGMSIYLLFSMLEKIISSNRDIKVWNISFGSADPVDLYSISPLGSLLDRLQCEYDVIFVVCGTNNESNDGTYPRVGSPADSVNSIVVNAICTDGKVPAYARSGPILKFLGCPDVSVFGGDKANPMHIVIGSGDATDSGTSYATPWVARKMAFLMHRLDLPRECAKALLIDAAYGWDNSVSPLIGRGIVPVRIEDIITCDKNEVKFFINGVCNHFHTYTHDLTVPIDNGKYPFLAKATLCYTTPCTRKNGVDYTDYELDLCFGRVKKDGLSIDPIDDNRQGDSGNGAGIFESEARRVFDKWNNVKHISEGVKERSTGKKVYYIKKDATEYGQWGVRLDRKVRGAAAKDPKGVSFGLVLTFRSVDKKARYEEMRYYLRKEWIVEDLDISLMNEIHAESDVEIEFED